MADSRTFRVGTLEVVFTVQQHWDGGFIGGLAITNTGDAAMEDWLLFLDAGFEITNLWRAALAPAEGSGLQLSAPSWQRAIAPGETFAVGFEATGTPDADFAITGEAQSEPSEPEPEPVPDETTPPPVVAVEALDPVSEGEALAFRLTLSEPATEPVVVTYATADGSADSGADYVAATATVTFAAGETEKVVTIATRDDAVIETNETVALELTEAVGATIGTATATATIRSDDVPALAITGTGLAEGDLLARTTSGLGALSTDGNRIVDGNGDAVTLAGVNWFGMETERFRPDGLHLRNWQDMMEQMVELGFNTIRLPFSNAALDVGRMPSDIDYALNPDLAGLTSLQILDKIVDYADTLGLRILLDNHRSTAGDGPEANGLWYTADYSEQRWLSDWTMLAGRYADAPAVIGADLRNEPHAASWGGGGADDWAAAAERAGNAILATGSEWLIVVEGVQAYEDDYYWWGGNLQGVADRPVQLARSDKLVYSPHAYSPEVYEQPWFQGPEYPGNLPAVWDKNFGFIHQQNIAPLLVGEFGNRYEDARNQQWLDAFAAYLAGDFDGDGSSELRAGETGLSWTYWAWNPNSGDTGGILEDDWQTPVAAKLTALDGLIQAGTDFDSGGAAGEVEVAERGLAEVVVALAEPSFEEVRVDWRTEDGTATANEDYEAGAGALRFAPGETQKTITLTVYGDDVVEGDESFDVVLDPPAGAAASDRRATVTIRDDDVAPADEEPTPGPEPEPEDPASGPLAAVDVGVDVEISQWWYQIDVTLTNTADRAVTDWLLTLPGLASPDQVWNASVVASDAPGTTFASNQSWSQSLAPGQTVGFGMGGDPGALGAGALDPDILADSAVFEGLFI